MWLWKCVWGCAGECVAVCMCVFAVNNWKMSYGLRKAVRVTVSLSCPFPLKYLKERHKDTSNYKSTICFLYSVYNNTQLDQFVVSLYYIYTRVLPFLSMKIMICLIIYLIKSYSLNWQPGNPLRWLGVMATVILHYYIHTGKRSHILLIHYEHYQPRLHLGSRISYQVV